jgi:hypothetical protein
MTTPPHIRDILAKHETTFVPQSPDSSDIAPADFLLFPKRKFTLKDRFQSVENIQENSLAELPAIAHKAFQQCFQNCPPPKKKMGVVY